MIGYLLDGRYELLQAIGSGGMSVVYMARLNNVGKMVAIKTLNIQVKSKDNVKERFHREIDLLLKLEHPHIVAVQDCLYGPNHQPYLVMDLLRGVTLEQELAKSGTLPSERVRKIMIQVCAAVKYAHQHAVVHRDLKPGNIMLLENEVDFVKVLDFGLALIGENTRKITQSGEFWGSPPYASPEQVKGEETDHRSDIYSLGCVMYELLSGKDPFHGAGLFELLTKHVNEQPAPFSVTNSEVIVPAEMERIVFKCLEKRPQDRFQTVAELQAALENMDHNKGINRLRGEQTVIANAEPVREKSNSVAFLVGAVLILLVLTVLGFKSMTRISQTAESKSPSLLRDSSLAPDMRPDVSNTRSPGLTPKPKAASQEPVSQDVVQIGPRVKNPSDRWRSVRRRESSGSRSVGAAGGARPISKPISKPVSKSSAPPKSDPFARLREHMSAGAKSE